MRCSNILSIVPAGGDAEQSCTLPVSRLLVLLAGTHLSLTAYPKGSSYGKVKDE
jgi:hypothetical protein